jgi:dipeptidyl aminopeptidase/acylaminoacyl peptidase
VALSAPTDLCRRFPDPWAEGLRFSVFGEDQWEAASPARRAGATSPPFLIVHGDRDAVVPVEHARALHDALRAGGRPSRLVVVRGAGHGFEPVGRSILARPLAAVNLLRVTRHVLRFLDRHLRRRGPP